MVGATLGAGVGPLTGLHGLVIDALLLVRMVTGTGELIDVSATENADLFWGLRGAGYNFGIITSATYKIHDQTNGGQIMNADLLFPASANGTVWKILQSFQDNQPDALSLMVHVQYLEAFGGVSYPKAYTRAKLTYRF
jgi:FAD/FMN-containing dehydrogenase